MVLLIGGFDSVIHSRSEGKGLLATVKYHFPLVLELNTLAFYKQLLMHWQLQFWSLLVMVLRKCIQKIIVL